MNKKKKTGRQNQRSVSVFRQHKRSVVLILAILVVLAAVLSVNSVTLYKRNQAYKQQEAELKAQIKEEKARAEEVKAYEEYVKTDDYIKEVAEEKLGLVDPNEIVFKTAE